MLNYSYNNSQRDALFLKFILVKNSTCFGQIRGLNTIYTSIGICHASEVRVELHPDLSSGQHEKYLLLCVQC